MSDSRTILAIETSNPAAPHAGESATGPGVCLLRRDPQNTVVVLAHAPIAPKKRHDDALLPAIDSVCQDAGVSPGDLDLVAVSIGPGGYTTIRIAVTVTKTIAASTGCACVGVPTAEGIVHAAHITTPALVALAWKRGDVWVQPYDTGSPEGDGRVVELCDLKTAAHGRTLIAEDRLLEQVEHAGVHAPPIFSAHAIGEIGIGRPAVDPIALLPLYPREPEAVRKWNALRR